MSWKPAQEPSRIPQWVPPRLRGFIKWGVKWGIIGACLLFIFVLYYLYLAMQYDLDDVAKIPERSIIYDRDGWEFSTIHGERRRLVTRAEIPEIMVQALYAREDARFPEHHGVDVKGLIRATFRNIKDRSFTQGASTLTMQLTRNTYELRAKSLHRKFLEIALTLRLETRYSKDEILTHYLNRIYFGSGCHGIEEAAQTYFGRSAKELNTAESTMLVGIIRGPHVFSPFRNLKRAKDQQEEVLARMLASGFLTEIEVEQVEVDKLRLVPEGQRSSSSNSYVKEMLRIRLGVILENFKIKKGGLKVYTTLDIEAQKRCEDSLKAPISGLKNQEEIQAAIVKLDRQTGGILALCGGRDYAKSSYNRAYNTRRDLGGAFQPFLHAFALERRKVAIAGSVIQTGRQLGVEETVRLCKRIGFSGPFVRTEDLYRGALAVTPMELAMASLALQDEGMKHEPYLISKITDTSGQVLYQHVMSETKVLHTDVAADTLKKYHKLTMAGGYGSTTASCRDAWGVQSSSADLTTLWIGSDKPRRLGEKADALTAVKDILLKNK